MNKSALENISQSLDAIELSLKNIRDALRLLDKPDAELIREMTFREFTAFLKSKGERRIARIPFFSASVGRNVRPIPIRGVLCNYADGQTTIGDIPMKLLMAESNKNLSAIRGISCNGLIIFDAILEEYGIIRG